MRNIGETAKKTGMVIALEDYCKRTGKTMRKSGRAEYLKAYEEAMIHFRNEEFIQSIVARIQSTYFIGED